MPLEKLFAGSFLQIVRFQANKGLCGAENINTEAIIKDAFVKDATMNSERTEKLPLIKPKTFGQ